MSTTDATPPAGTPVEGAVALVSGGFRGFGRAMVDELLDRGAAKVYATSRTARPTGDGGNGDPRIVPLVLDVASDRSVAAAAEAAPDVSILVNNAGISLETPVLTAPLDDIRTEMEVNLFGILRMTRAFGPALTRHPSSAIVNVLSVLAWLAVGRGYEATKAAAWSATNSLRDAVRDQGTTVTALLVAYMDTDMVAHLDVDKADPRAIARLTTDAIVAGTPELLADDTTRWVKSQLAVELT
jgi:NAD(P)-dependent dehydrogenase (short-subunit alcohol dehydrogenase family)